MISCVMKMMKKYIKSLIHTNELDTGLLIGKTRSLKSSIKIFNNQNSASIDINKYQPYDIVRYENDGKFYQFTTPEFDWLIKRIC
jgi:hypothetical protein